MSASNVERAEPKNIKDFRTKNGLIFCYFFATPTRLADGLGTKEYPFILRWFAPARLRCLTLGPPLPKHRDSVINFSTPK